MSDFLPVAYGMKGKPYYFWVDGNDFAVTRFNERLMEDPIDHLYKWIDFEDCPFDKDFSEVAVFPSMHTALKVADETI